MFDMRISNQRRRYPETKPVQHKNYENLNI